ncbi:hypothetical protein TL16_g07992 [Triparma laevis f. inornata]|uniref:Cap-specific mRNA (nucleoside-2'-O-)-methyltransferase 1 n=1 Tax=Triparma laevis f. inornata TaxID=1714386 RepID=A0A9W7AVA3_9STRA|nr:hypothetical protein TL16_g07992 [Triparma laevis f. inornata]
MGRKSKSKNDPPADDAMDVDTLAIATPKASKKKRRRPRPNSLKSSSSYTSSNNPSLRNCWLTSNDSTSPFTLSPHLLWCSPSTHTNNRPLILPSTFSPLLSQLITLKKSLNPTSTTHSNMLNSSLKPGGSQILLTEPSSASNSFRISRIISNPFDHLTTKRGVAPRFVNRSAIKLSNIDHILDYALTSLGDLSLPLKFLDLCGAPGGFSEYIIYRSAKRNRRARGWGMSLREGNEEGVGCPWRLEHLIGIMNEGDVGYRVVEGEDGTGDIYNLRNVEELRKQIEIGEKLRGVSATTDKASSVSFVAHFVTVTLTNTSRFDRRSSQIPTNSPPK